MGVKLVTGNGCTVGADDDRVLHAATISSKKVVFGNVGDMFSAEILSNNEIRINSGEGMNQGAHFRIPYGDSEVVNIENGTQGLNRKDLIVARYQKNMETLEETITLAVIKGIAAVNAVEPEYNVGNLYAGDIIDDFPLYAVNIEGLSIVSVDKKFKLLYDIENAFNQIKEMSTKKLLATGPSHLMSKQTLYLSEKISEQTNGIAIVFSNYDMVSKTPVNEDFQCFFVPKYQVSAFNGRGHNFFMVNNPSFKNVCSKYLYIYDDKIVGDDINATSGTSNGITYNNYSLVLRYVIGV